MGGPEKPFSCPQSGCGASFTNEDRLTVHAKKHDMVLQLGNKGGAFVDQTPTPTRFIRNCEEVGLFQELQNVNPFDETFKRAMETRLEPNHLTLDETHLSAVNSDGTLHTPLIFPPDDNTATIYSSDGVQRGTLRMSSDDSAHQLSVVKCLSSSVEDNLLQEPESRLINKRLKRKSDSSSSKSNKLVRQHSIDLADISFETEKTSTESDKTDTSGSMLQIPVISISDASDPKHIKDISETVLRGDGLLTPNRVISKESFDLGKATAFTKLMSQKSIYMELDKLTDGSQKSVDLNVSIDDIPSLHLGSNEINSVIKETLAEQRNSTSMDGSPNSRRARLSLSISTESPEVQNISDIGKMKRNSFKMLKKVPTAESPTPQSNREMPIIENIGGQPMVDSEGKGVYELLLKWPDGQKIYLKEVYREKELEKASKAVNTSSEEKQVNSVALKQKLKEVIQNKDKKTIHKNIQTQPVVLPENCIVIPQLSNISPVIIQNKIVPQPVLMSVIPKEDAIIASNGLTPIAPLPQEASYKLPVIQTNRKSSAMLLPSTRIENNVQSVIKMTPPKTDSQPSKAKANEEKNTSQNDKNELQKRNRAAVHRYRMRRNAMITTLQQNHKKLNDDYNVLQQKYAEAMREISRLNGLLSAVTNSKKIVLMDGKV